MHASLRAFVFVGKKCVLSYEDKTKYLTELGTDYVDVKLQKEKWPHRLTAQFRMNKVSAPRYRDQ